MSSYIPQRKVALILAADVAGYSALAERDEEAAIAAIALLRTRTTEIVTKQGGRIFNTAGDAVMVEFPAASAALAAAEALLADTDLPTLRLGLHAGEVSAAANGDLLGHGVNVAARLQQAAPPGAGLVSIDVKRLLRGAAAKRLKANGALMLAKMSETIETFLLRRSNEGVSFDGDSAPSSLRPTREGDGRSSLAIMPFTTRSGMTDDEAFALGMVEDIAAVLSPNPMLRVLAPSATRHWAGSTPDLRHVASELGVTYVLEGNVRRAGTNLRVTVQLIDTGTDAIAWNGQFERPLADLAALQEDLLAEMTSRLGVELMEVDRTRALKKPGDITAYEAFQRALAYWFNLTLANFPLLIAEARRAVAIAPDYGTAHGLLAYALALQFVWGGGNDEQLKRGALDHAGEAIALEPGSVMTHAYVAGAFICLDMLPDAVRHAERAVEINPNYLIGQQQLGLAYLRLGRNDEAVSCFDMVESLRPSASSVHLTYLRRSHAHFQAGRRGEAIADMERAFSHNSNYCPTLVLRGGLCALSDRGEAATDAVQRLRALEPNTSGDAQATRALTWLHPEQSADLMAAFRGIWERTPARGEV